jgi:RimJ/RimL family protein N-acetyltransferase
MPAPRIETDRLLLSAHRLEDLPDCAAMWADPEVTRYIGGRPNTAEEAWQRVLRQVGHWELMGFGYWVVREKSSGRFVGEVGFADLKRDLEPSLGDSPEMGWVLAPWCHGRGYATEAVRACLRWGDTTWGRRRVVCIIDPRNLASLRVAERAGFKEFARSTYHGDPTVILERQG